MGTMLQDLASLEQSVRKHVAEVTVTDIHTHLFPPAHGNLLLWGLDELLTYHYLLAELFTVAPRSLTPEAFYKLSRRQQADLVWKHLFVDHSPLSEAARGVVTALKLLGPDVARRNPDGLRQWFDAQNIDSYIQHVFQTANIDYAVMTNSPFIAGEYEFWLKGAPCPDFLKTALRIDTLMLDWQTAAAAMEAQGYYVADSPDAKSFSESRRFLKDWARRIKPLYMAASLPPDFTYPADTPACRILNETILPVAAELGLPFAMMIGVRRGVNPMLADGGDGLGQSNLETVGNLCAKHSNLKFLCTTVSRADQHELCALARLFSNLHIFGCWWYCNTPSAIRDITSMRLELLDTAFTFQHSDARVLDQLIYKWAHSRQILADVLTEKYRDLFNSGWRPTDAEIHRDVRSICGGSFAEFLAR